MFIVPISSMSSISSINSLKPAGIDKSSQIGGADQTAAIGFKDVFSQAVGNVEQTENVVSQDAYNLSVGKTDDLHTMMIDAAKADLALQTMVQLRNKMIEAYTEVMRINL